MKLRPRSAYTGLLIPRIGNRKQEKASVKRKKRTTKKLRQLRKEMVVGVVPTRRRQLNYVLDGDDSLLDLDREEYKGHGASHGGGRLRIVRAQSAARRPRSTIKQRVRPATATRARTSKLHGGGSGRNPVGSLPVSQLGHVSAAANGRSSVHDRSNAGKTGSASINNTYSDFVRMLALFYDASDHSKIVKKACDDALKLQEKMCLHEFTG